MATVTIQKRENESEFIVRWKKEESDKYGQNGSGIECEPTTVHGNYTHKSTAPKLLGVVTPCVNGKALSGNQVSTIDDQTIGIDETLGELGGCHQNGTTSKLPERKPLPTMPINTNERKVQRVVPYTKVSRQVNTVDDRECLANALQCHIKDLVGGLIFTDSELPDALISSGCLTDEESSRMRNMRCRKDQIRVLVCLIKGRDFHVMNEFMKLVVKHNPALAKVVIDTFEKNKQDGIGITVCTFCKLANHCDVKDVGDNLWGHQLIADDLYVTICHSDKPVGAQRELWTTLVKALRCLNGKKLKLADEQLENALRAKGVFTYLLDKVNIGRMVCSCKYPVTHHKRYSSTSSSEESCDPDSSSDSTPPIDDTASD